MIYWFYWFPAKNIPEEGRENEKDDQKSNTDVEKQSDNKSSSPSFGFFDFSSSNDKKDDSNEENGSNKDKEEK